MVEISDVQNVLGLQALFQVKTSIKMPERTFTRKEKKGFLSIKTECYKFLHLCLGQVSIFECNLLKGKLLQMCFLSKKRENVCFHLPGIRIVLRSPKRYADPQRMKIIENKNF